VVFLGLVAYYAYNYYNYLNMTRDSDGDGIPDVDEANKYHTDPNSRDTDSDGLTDYQEIFAYHTDPLKPDPNVKHALDLGLEKYIDIVKPLDNDGVQDSNERQFVELMANSKKALDVPTFINYLKEKASDGRITREELEYSSNFASLVKGIYIEIYKAKNLYENNTQYRITNPLKTIDYSTSLGLRLGFDRELAKDATAKAIGYYGIAVVDRELPENFDEISLLTNSTQIDEYGDKLVDFSPIVFYSVDGNNFVLTPDAGRETWMLARHLKLIMESGFNILEHPEMFEGLNGKIIANAYSIFDAKYGVNYAEQTLNRKTLKPIDNDVWDLIMLQWNLYSNKAPQLGGGDKLYNRDFPWYDSDKLDALYQDANTRRQALLFLFHIDNGTFDTDKMKTVVGVEGAKTALIKAEREYEAISKLYPDGKIGRWNEDPRNFYYGWLVDRQNNGLSNTVYQYIGIKLGEYRNDDEFIQLVNQRNAIDQYITKNWKYWDLVKFVMGYERWKYTTVPNMIERHTINYSIQQTLKAFGFPTYFGEIEPTPEGAAYYEWVVSLPDYIVNKLKSEFNDKIIIGPANGFGLYLCKDGLIKDGISEIFGFSGGTGLLADKEPSLGLGWNFKFYLFRK
jgi:hypothetical protein